jgi:serine/threonine protein kinase
MAAIMPKEFTSVYTLQRALATDVWTAVRHADAPQTPVVVKFVKETSCETAALAAVRNVPHVVQVLDDSLCHDGRRAIVMPYYERGDLMDRVEHAPLPEIDALRAIRQVATALVGVHAAGVAHRDLKLENVLCGDDGTCVLTDFGFAAIREPTMYNRCGTRLFVAPEVLHANRFLNRGYTYSCDIWSLGVSLYALVNKHMPFTSDRDVASAGVLAHKMRKTVSMPTRRVIAAMLRRNAAHRPTAEQVVAQIDEALLLLQQ